MWPCAATVAGIVDHLRVGISGATPLAPSSSYHPAHGRPEPPTRGPRWASSASASVPLEVSLGPLVSDYRGGRPPAPCMASICGRLRWVDCVGLQFIGDGLRDAFTPPRRSLERRL